jgi:hypothetical protein
LQFSGLAFGSGFSVLGSGLLLIDQLLEHLLGVDQMVVKDRSGEVEQLQDHRVAHPVVDGGAFLAVVDKPAGAEDPKLARDILLLQAKELLELCHAALSVAQCL